MGKIHLEPVQLKESGEPLLRSTEKQAISWALSYFHVTHPMNPLHNLFKQTPTMLTSLSEDLSCSVTASAASEASLLTVSILINLFSVTSLNTETRAAAQRAVVSAWFHSPIPGAATYKNGCRPLTARETLLWAYLRNAVSRWHGSTRGPFIWALVHRARVKSDVGHCHPTSINIRPHVRKSLLTLSLPLKAVSEHSNKSLHLLIIHVTVIYPEFYSCRIRFAVMIQINCKLDN